MAELFIAGRENEILYGKVAQRYLPGYSGGYPAAKVDESLVSYLKIGEIFLGIKYKEEDCFEAAKILLLFRNYLKSRMTEITASNIQKKYFELFTSFHITDLFDSLYSDGALDDDEYFKDHKVYIDCVESYNCRQDVNGRVLGESSYGVMSCKGYGEEMRIRMKKKDNVVIKSNYQMIEDNNDVVLNLRRIRSKVTLLTYHRNSVTGMFKCEISNGKYTFEWKDCVTFSVLDIFVPVVGTVQCSDVEATSGSVRWNTDEGTVCWNMVEPEAGKKEIRVPEENTVKNNASIKIKFVVKSGLSPGVQTVHCVSRKNKTQCWARNVIQSGTVEISLDG